MTLAGLVAGAAERDALVEHTVVAVSYTRLDVYKRQQRKRSRSALVSSSHDHTVLRHAMLKIM